LVPFLRNLHLSIRSAMASGIEASSPYVAEFTGTFMLVVTVGCCCLAGDTVWSATAIACVLMVMVYAFGSVSGGHFNPAVTLSCYLAKKTPGDIAVRYVITQMIAGICAGSFFYEMVGEGSDPPYVTLAPAAPFTWKHAMAAEVIYTTLLCFVVLNVACSSKNNPAEDQNHFFALAIGFVIVAGGYAVGGISGACFNPAVSFGLDFSRLGHRVFLGWASYYAVWQCMGAVLARFLFALVRPDDESGATDVKLQAKLISEFLGTFMLVFTVGANVVMKSPATAWSAAASLMCMIYALGNVSGAHFNPAVSVALMASGRNVCSAKDGCLYIVTQLIAGALAGAAYSALHAAGPNSSETFGLAPGAQYTHTHACCAEFAFTFVLAYVVLTVATVSAPLSWTKQNFQFGLAIGSCVTAGGIAIGAVSGGELNPAVSLGLSSANLWSHGKDAPPPFSNCVTFGLSEVAGGVFASMVMFLTHPSEFKQK